jgi:hypothetical protein
MTRASLAALLPRLLPGAIAWAEHAALGARGRPLTADETSLARAVGVAAPERVRVAEVDALPAPADPVLHAAGVEAGLLAPGMVGLTLGHAIFAVRGHCTRRLLSHELRHVHQYEQAGSIAAFLPVYLAQVVECGYREAAYEQDARRHEVGDA